MRGSWWQIAGAEAADDGVGADRLGAVGAFSAFALDEERAGKGDDEEQRAENPPGDEGMALGLGDRAWDAAQDGREDENCED